MRQVIRWIRMSGGRENKEKGLTLIEILVAMTILTTTLIGVEMSVAAGLAKLKDQQVSRMSAECTRIIMEYFSTLPADAVYNDNTSKGQSVNGSFTGAGYPGLNAFVSGANSACRDLSMHGKVAMAYSVCPSCLANTQVNPATMVESTTCMYELGVKLSFRGLTSSANKHFEYKKKFFEEGSDCGNICGKGDPTKPDTIFECTYQ